METFFLNLCRNGRVDGMSMCEPFFNGGLRLIRPLLLVEKKYILKAARQWGLPGLGQCLPLRRAHGAQRHGRNLVRPLRPDQGCPPQHI